MRADRLIPPPAKPYGKIGGYFFAYHRCVGTARLVIVDVGVVARNRRQAPDVPSTAGVGRDLFLAEDAVRPKQPAERQTGPTPRIGKQACVGQPLSGLHGGDGFPVVLPETRLQVLIDGTEVVGHVSSSGVRLTVDDALRAES
jgi:hypothetical protein